MSTVSINFDINAKKAKSDLSSIDKSLKTLGKSVNTTSIAFGSMLGSLAASAFSKSINLLKSLSSELVESASKAEETQAKFDTVFKNMGNSANAAAEDLAKSFGISGLAAKKMMSDTGDLLTGLGFTRQAALDLSKEVNALAVDLASFTNYSGGAEGASRQLTKALLGERDGIKMLGISILEEDVKAQMLLNTQEGMYFATEKQAKAYATMQLMMQQSKNAIGDYARTSMSYANSQRRLNARLEDLYVSLGKKLLPVATSVINAVEKIVVASKEFTDTKLPEYIDRASVAYEELKSSLAGLLETMLTIENMISLGMMEKLHPEIKKFHEDIKKISGETSNLTKALGGIAVLLDLLLTAGVLVTLGAILFSISEVITSILILSEESLALGSAVGALNVIMSTSLVYLGELIVKIPILGGIIKALSVPLGVLMGLLQKGIDFFAGLVAYLDNLIEVSGRAGAVLLGLDKALLRGTLVATMLYSEALNKNETALIKNAKQQSAYRAEIDSTNEYLMYQLGLLTSFNSLATDLDKIRISQYIAEDRTMPPALDNEPNKDKNMYRSKEELDAMDREIAQQRKQNEESLLRALAEMNTQYNLERADALNAIYDYEAENDQVRVDFKKMSLDEQLQYTISIVDKETQYKREAIKREIKDKSEQAKALRKLDIANQKEAMKRNKQVATETMKINNDITKSVYSAGIDSLAMWGDSMAKSADTAVAISSAAGAAQAIINGLLAQTLAAATIPPPAGEIVGARLLTQAYVNAGLIAAKGLVTMGTNGPKKYASGGIVEGSSYFGDQVPIKVNSGEMVLNASQQKQLLDIANSTPTSNNNDAMLALANRPIVVEIDGHAIASTVRDQVNDGFDLGVN